MPIAVEVVSKEKFAEWVAAKQAENGITPPRRSVAAAGAPARFAAGCQHLPCRGARRCARRLNKRDRHHGNPERTLPVRPTMRMTITPITR